MNALTYFEWLQNFAGITCSRNAVDVLGSRRRLTFTGRHFADTVREGEL